MPPTPDPNESHAQPSLSRGSVAHPKWCDPARCTADPASQANGYQPGTGGEHRSAAVPLNLTTAYWLPVRDGMAWLTEACTPWPCDAYLRVQVGDAHISMPADHAGRVIYALSTLLASAATEEVNR